METNKQIYLLGPLLILVYGLVRIFDGLDDRYGPGVAWSVGHLAFLAGLAFFVPAILELRRRTGRPALATVLALVTLVGMAALTVQFVIDLSVGFAATSRAEMSSFFDEVTEIPGAEPIVYTVVPPFFFIGLVAQLAVAAAARRLPWWSPVVALAGGLLIAAEKDLMPVGGVLLGLALLPLASTAAAPVGERPVLRRAEN